MKQIFSQTNKRWLYGLTVILVGLIGLQRIIEFSFIPLDAIGDNYYLLLYLLNIWAGLNIIGREL